MPFFFMVAQSGAYDIIASTIFLLTIIFSKNMLEYTRYTGCNIITTLKQNGEGRSLPSATNKYENKERSSGVELLKIIATFIIVISHFLPKYGGNGAVDLGMATINLQRLLLVFCNYQKGSCIFLVCAAWFLLDQNEVEPRCSG